MLDVTKVKRIYIICVGQYMLEQRGRDCGSIIVGSSVHNQRIERLFVGHVPMCNTVVLSAVLFSWRKLL